MNSSSADIASAASAGPPLQSIENLSWKPLQLTLAFDGHPELSATGVPFPLAGATLQRRNFPWKGLRPSRAQLRPTGRQLREDSDSFSPKLGECWGSVSRGRFFAERDAAVIEAGEASGRLDAVFGELAEFYAQLAQTRRAVIAKSIYPLLVLPLRYGSERFLATHPQFALTQLPIRKDDHPGSSTGTLSSKWTLWKFTSVLSLYVAAGGGLLRAFEMAGMVCENADLKATTSAALSRVKHGEGLGEAFRKQPGFPESLLRSIEVGEYADDLMKNPGAPRKSLSKKLSTASTPSPNGRHAFSTFLWSSFPAGASST